jgi:hypothetical protein
MSFGVYIAKIGLSTSVPLFGKGFPLTKGGCVVTTLVRSDTLVKISTRTIPRTSKKHGKGQADGRGQVFHTEILDEISGVDKVKWCLSGGLNPYTKDLNPLDKTPSIFS